MPSNEAIFFVYGHFHINVTFPSILTQEFKKSEIKTVEELFEKIENSPISPKPECESLKFIWNWRDYIHGYLSNKQLKNHSFYNAFMVTKEVSKEKKEIKLRAKRLPQDLEWVPPTGICLVQPNTVYDPVGCAEFRVENLMLSKIVANLQKYFKRMPTHVRVKVADSWLKLKDSLERIPRMQENLTKMKLADLPKISMELEQELPDEYSFAADDDDERPEIEGDVYEEGLFETYIRVGLDVVIYTESREERPWIGRVARILEDKKFDIHWFRRNGKGTKFHAMFNPDGTP